jgi:uncharacterized protein (DUF885 family)
MKQSAMVFVLLAAVLVTGCAPRQTEDQKFEGLASNYIQKLLEMNPEWATGLGDHRYDSRMGDYSLAGVDADRKFTRVYLDSLGSIRADQLGSVNRIDYEILKTNLQARLFGIDTLREYEWNPQTYNPGGAIYALIARDFAPLKERLGSVKGRLQEIPKVVAAAKANLKNPTKIHTETTIGQLAGTISMIRDELSTFVEHVPEMKADFASAQTEAVKALEEYAGWLKTDVLPKANGDFRIGEEKFRRKLYYSLESDFTKEQVLARAENDLKATEDAMYETAVPLYKKFFPGNTGAAKLPDRRAVIKAVLSKLADSHPTNESIIDMAKADLKAATDFVRSNNLVMVPDEPVKVMVMPEFLRGVAVAYCEAPGPLEKNAETFYEISPTPKDWTKQRTESFFREYNNDMLQNLTIHEGMPGHYLQLMHANRFKAPTLVRAIFSSGTFIEGWATYAEQLMAEKGYGGAEVRMQQLKMRLRLIINSIIDQKIHTAGMTEKEAMDMMMNDGFQEEGEAAGKWRRACLTSTQLSTYYVGNMEINGLRKAYEAKHPGTADARAMHDALLSLGSPAPKYVKLALGL